MAAARVPGETRGLEFRLGIDVRHRNAHCRHLLPFEVLNEIDEVGQHDMPLTFQVRSAELIV